MGKITGSASTEIEAPIETVFAAAADIEGSTAWQLMITVAECLERDRDGFQRLVRMETDGKVRQITTLNRFSYERPTKVSWVQEEGDLKSVAGSWEFEDLGDERTRASYWMEADFGRVLGMLIRGPVLDGLRGQMVDTMPEKLKRFVEDQAD